MKAKTMDVIRQTVNELYIDALSDGDCRRTDAFYWELGEVTSVEELQNMRNEGEHAERSATTRR